MSAYPYDRASAQEAGVCAQYQATTSGIPSKGVPIVPDALLQDIKIAVPCLVTVIGGLEPGITSPKMPPDGGSKLLSATAALRAIMARQGALDAASGTPNDTTKLNEFISLFRDNDNIAVVSVLTYAARSDIYDARLNSVLILGNIIDNTTVCVPIAHLNDPELDSTDYGKNGRANLLGIVSVVAPWAYFENYDAIEQTRALLSAKVGENPDYKTTRTILDNIDKRLRSQTNQTNRSVPLPAEFKTACKNYIDAYRAKHTVAGTFKY
ncbi:hypothetical protein [Bradyrhizobium sp. USDA 3650]